MSRFSVDKRVLVLVIARMADLLSNSFLIVVLQLFIASGRLRGGILGLSETLISGLVIRLFAQISSPLSNRSPGERPTVLDADGARPPLSCRIYRV